MPNGTPVFGLTELPTLDSGPAADWNLGALDRVLAGPVRGDQRHGPRAEFRRRGGLQSRIGRGLDDRFGRQTGAILRAGAPVILTQH